MDGRPNGQLADLPKADCPTLALVQPTEEEEALQSTRNGVCWKGPLSLQAYVRRERFLASQDFTRDGGLTGWALIDTAAKQRVVLAACESIRKKSIVARDGSVKDVVTHGIGSVFCPSEHRGKGYAGRMMRELAKQLQTWQTSEKRECLFSVLYSDIGKKFYAKHGWEPFPSAHISLHATTEQPHAGKLPAARDLRAEDLAELCAADEMLLRKSVLESSADGRTHVAIIPDIATIRWHHAREEFVGREHYGDVPVIKGAMVGEERGRRIWCYWTRMWYNEDKNESKGNTLHMLRLVIEEEVVPGSVVPAIAALLARARREAAAWHMAEVETWNPSPETVAAARLLEPETEVVDRDEESIASLMWYGQKPVDGGSVAEAVQWVGNEKYGWC